MIKVYNRSKERHFGPNNYQIFRPNVLSNPFTHIKDRKTKAMYICSSKEEAIEQYSYYYDAMYSGNKAFKDVIDEIYTKYRNGEDIFLECYCAPNPCHGDVIVKKLQERLIKEKIQENLKNSEKNLEH